MVNEGKVEDGICGGKGRSCRWDGGEELELWVLGDGIQGIGVKGERQVEGEKEREILI